MTNSPNTPQQSKHRGPKHQFLVHFLKITRLATQAPSSNVDGALQKSARRDAVKVTALFNSQQIALGDFPISENECVIDQKLTCQFTISKSGTQSKLHLYIDQTYSSGLAGHIALDLQEFIREDETEIYLKYPLYANTSHYCRGPVLKIIIQNLGRRDVEATIAEDNEILLLPHPGIERLHSSRICTSDDPGCPSQDLTLSSQFDLSRRDQRCHLEEASLEQLEGALSDIGEKLKALVSTFKNRDSSQNGDYLAADAECQSSTTSPLLSSLHTGTSMDSHSEIYGEQCTDSDDVFDTSFELGSSVYPLSISKHSRTWSDISSLASNLRYRQALTGRRNTSTEESSESWRSQRDTLNDSDKYNCLDECFMCSSAPGLQSYEGLQASLSRSKSLSARPKSLHLKDRQSALAELPAPLERQHQENNGADAPVARKGPGLLKSLFGTVLVVGVSLLGARNSMSKDRSQSSGLQSKLGQTSRASFSNDTRNDGSIRNRYSFRR